VKNGFMVFPERLRVLIEWRFNFREIQFMFSSNCVFDLLTQSTQFDFTVRCFVLSVFPQRSVFLTYKVANFTIDPGRGVGICIVFIGTKLVTIDTNVSFHCIQQSSILAYCPLE
jgi:hypothetical protein